MKYYLYQSDSKVNMFFNQENHDLLKGIALELGFDWKIVSAKVSKEFDSRDNKKNKLQIVEKLIRKKENVVSFDVDGNWISGELKMTAMEFEENSSTIFYLGESENTVLLLGGSSFHLLGGDKRERVSGNLSHTHRLVGSLQKNLDRINLSDSEIERYEQSKVKFYKRIV